MRFVIRPKKPPRHKETWWCNDEVKLLIEEKRRLFKSWKNTKNEEDKKHNAAKYRAKNVIGKVQHEQRLRFIEDLEQENEKGNIFKVTRQMVHRSKDVVGGGSMKDKNGKVVVNEPDVMETWRQYYNNLLNEEFD